MTVPGGAGRCREVPGGAGRCQAWHLSAPPGKRQQWQSGSGGDAGNSLGDNDSDECKNMVEMGTWRKSMVIWKGAKITVGSNLLNTECAS